MGSDFLRFPREQQRGILALIVCMAILVAAGEWLRSDADPPTPGVDAMRVLTDTVRRSRVKRDTVRRRFSPYERKISAFDNKKSKSQNLFSKPQKTRTFASVKYTTLQTVDLNLADTTELLKIPGIGIVSARKIVDYRRRLGGFHTVEQLTDIKLYAEMDSLLRWFTVSDTAVLARLNINRLPQRSLQAHPYLNYKQARLIVEHRRKKGQLSRLYELSLYEEFTPDDLSRLQPYVCFD
ncbi:MAG: helix-hairpin-helix domain-containing protein [Prevotellaceae bacterium]|jgi:DNA uptake protein ComE-like DNA-binding protein|nr:helix-hairpin-helix domain-containing protein [Prevotellaceae bacterium]